MAAMRAVGNGHQFPAHAKVREDACEYLIQLDVSDFSESELSVEAFGPRLTVRGDQVEIAEDNGKPAERRNDGYRNPDNHHAWSKR